MPAPRKVFRIEEIAAPPREAPTADGLGCAEIMNELVALRRLLAGEPGREGAIGRNLPPDDLERITAKLRLIRSTIIGAGPEQAGAGAPRPAAMPQTRIAKELEAVIDGSEQATQKILAAVEEIDQAANNLSAALKGDLERDLAQDIRDRVVAIFEACNFQDLTSQRVVKVMASLTRIEQQIARTLDELAREAAPPLHGPRLEGEPGHASQADVDSMFAG